MFTVNYGKQLFIILFYFLLSLSDDDCLKKWNFEGLNSIDTFKRTLLIFDLILEEKNLELVLTQFSLKMNQIDSVDPYFVVWSIFL